MIEALRMAQRSDLDDFATGIADLFAGRETDDAIACAQNLSHLLWLAGNTMTGNKWSR